MKKIIMVLFLATFVLVGCGEEVKRFNNLDEARVGVVSYIENSEEFKKDGSHLEEVDMDFVRCNECYDFWFEYRIAGEENDVENVRVEVRDGEIINMFLGKEGLRVEDGGEDKVLNLFEDLKEATGIMFLEPALTQFPWQVMEGGEIKPLILWGGQIEIKETEVDPQLVKDFFINQGFEIDKNNNFSGFVGRVIGYTKEDLRCVVKSGISGYSEKEQKMPENTGKNDIEIYCNQEGKFSDLGS